MSKKRDPREAAQQRLRASVTATWPVVLRKGEASPVENIPATWTEDMLHKFAAVHGPELRVRHNTTDGVLELVMDPRSVEGLTCKVEDRVEMWRNTFIWCTSTLWTDLKVPYDAVWMLLYNLLDSHELSAGDLMNALVVGQKTLQLDSQQIMAVGDDHRSRAAHLLLQQFLITKETARNG